MRKTSSIVEQSKHQIYTIDQSKIFPQSNLDQMQSTTSQLRRRLTVDVTSKEREENKSKENKKPDLDSISHDMSAKIGAALDSKGRGHVRDSRHHRKSSLEEFQKVSIKKSVDEKEMSEEERQEDLRRTYENLEKNYTRRATLHVKENVEAKKYSISPAWAKLIMGVQERRLKRKQITKQRPILDHRFPNGSVYHGEWSTIGMQGKGKYRLFYDVLYEGEIENGEFYGFGNLTYPNKATITELFVNGMMKETGRYVFADKMQSQRYYLQYPDRRYHIEKLKELQPAGRSFLTNSLVARKIPNGCYDAGDGFYNPLTKCVYDFKRPSKILRIPTKYEHHWILENCRKAWDEVVGYRPDKEFPTDERRTSIKCMLPDKEISMQSIAFQEEYLDSTHANSTSNTSFTTTTT